MLELAQQIEDARQFIASEFDTAPAAGLILGTGLGGLAEQIETAATIPYEEIPHFPTSTVKEHAGQLVCGTLSGKPIVAMEGRFHFYEGYTMKQVTFPVRVMRALGAETLVVTNAAGGMNPQYALADICILEDVINLMGDNPLRGVNDDNLGPRFPDMLEPFDQELVAKAIETAREHKLPFQKGVFVGVAGPNLETRAEYRMLRLLGSDVVGMSTVPEVIVAKHAGMKCVGFSIVTDMCLPDALEPVEIEKIVEVAGIGGERLAKLIPALVAQL